MLNKSNYLLKKHFFQSFLNKKNPNKKYLTFNQSLFTLHTLIYMVNFHNFLVEHGKFPFPHPDELQSADTTNISQIEVGLLEREWKAKCAVRDNALSRKLCDALKNILGHTVLPAKHKKGLLAKFSPQLENDEYGQDEQWLTNPCEVHQEKTFQW